MRQSSLFVLAGKTPPGILPRHTREAVCCRPLGSARRFSYSRRYNCRIFVYFFGQFFEYFGLVRFPDEDFQIFNTASSHPSSFITPTLYLAKRRLAAALISDNWWSKPRLPAALGVSSASLQKFESFLKNGYSYDFKQQIFPQKCPTKNAFFQTYSINTGANTLNRRMHNGLKKMLRALAVTRLL